MKNIIIVKKFLLITICAIALSLAFQVINTISPFFRAAQDSTLYIEAYHLVYAEVDDKWITFNFPLPPSSSINSREGDAHAIYRTRLRKNEAFNYYNDRFTLQSSFEDDEGNYYLQIDYEGYRYEIKIFKYKYGIRTYIDIDVPDL